MFLHSITNWTDLFIYLKNSLMHMFISLLLLFSIVGGNRLRFSSASHYLLKLLKGHSSLHVMNIMNILCQFNVSKSFW